MTGRLRYVLAAAFVAFFFLLPGADPEQIAFLKTKAWLTAEGGPFEKSLVDEGTGAANAREMRLPGMRVEFFTPSDTIGGVTAADRRRAWEERLARLPREWTRSTNLRVFDDTLPAMALRVRIGDDGFLSEFGAPGLTTPIAPLELSTRTPPSAGYYPDRWSLLPAFLAIVLAILTGKVIPSLLLGCFAGAWLFLRDPIDGAVHLVRDTIWAKVLVDEFSVEIMVFVVFLFSCVGIMTRAGGIQGMVEQIRKYAKGPFSSQLCSYVIGLLIFFDDYTNCVITGSMMKPLTDRNRVSREKLSYIVDSTAAPIAGISIFSTWVAYEISMFEPQLPEVTDAAGIPYKAHMGFDVFVQTIPFRIYCVLTLVMVLATILLRREFGSMLTAERRALHEGKPVADDAQPMISKGFDKLEPPATTRCRARNAVLPVGLLVVLTLVLIFVYGHVNATRVGALDPGMGLGERLRTYLGHTQSQKALFWSSFAAMLLAAGLALGQRILTLRQVAHSAWNAAKALGFAIVILILAWTIGNICRDDVGTSQFLTAAFGSSFSPWLLPSILFLLSALVAFSTGTSYGTMAILLPNVIVLSHSMGAESEIGGPAMMLMTIGAVLEGSIFGDHCSPISDTTVLSSVASGSDHLHHVRTQAPYAVFVMIVSMLCGYLPLAFFGPQLWWVSWLTGIGLILGWLLIVGRSPERATA